MASKNPWEDNNSSKSNGDNSSKVKNIYDLKKGNNNTLFEFKWKIKWVIFAIIGLWLASGFYQVEPNEQGVIMRFGQYTNTTESGLHYRLPFPIDTVVKVNQTQERSFNLGASGNNYGNTTYNKYGSRYSSSTGSYDNFTESHMLTGDEKIVNIEMTIVWKIKDAKDYIFSLRETDYTVYVAAQSVLREIVGQSEMLEIITGDRGKVEEDTKRELQTVLDDFKSGIVITRVQLQKADPTQQVVDAFNEVQRARADKSRFQLEAQSYRNDIIPKAEGQAIELINDAEAYKSRIVNEAKGEAERFSSIYQSYKMGKDITSTRMYLSTMEEVMSKSNKVIIDPSAKGSNVLPLLNINK